MRITETFVVAASPEAVFDYMTNPSNLGEPLFKRGMAREFAKYHRNLQRNIASA